MFDHPVKVLEEILIDKESSYYPLADKIKILDDGEQVVLKKGMVNALCNNSAFLLPKNRYASFLFRVVLLIPSEFRKQS